VQFGSFDMGYTVPLSGSRR